MASITYTAKRSIATGHSSNIQYQLDISLQSASRKRAPVVELQVALSGQREASRIRADVSWGITLAPIHYSNLEFYREWLDSVEDRAQIFTFDPYGTIAVPVAAKSVYMNSENYTETLALGSGNYAQDFYEISSLEFVEV